MHGIDSLFNKNKLIDTHGGYLRVRYIGSKRVLDYLKDFDERSLQKVEFGKNLLDVKITKDHTERVTVLIPFGAKKTEEDEDGNVKKNAVDDMAGRESGGEGQNPKYVALLAGFAMLYMQQTNRDSKIRLVLLDEAFSKMDKERSEVCLHYARELELQLIVCVPDERLQSLIRNVDSVYGFRRYQNQVSMMHIDKGEYLDMIEGKI